MEAFYLYLIKSSGLIALFYLAYHLMLRKETFFTSNRWFLLLGLFTSVLLPLVVYTKIIWVEPTPVNYDWSSLPISTIVDEDHTQEYIYLGLAVLYCIGTLYLLTKFSFDFYSLQKIVKGKTIKRQADFKFIDLQDNLAPFSFFNTIVYNSSLYSSSELENILEHEKVHSEQNHTVDVLISRLFCIFFWFNPFIWLYKKAILQNLEFIADSEATKKISDKKAYQLTLLKITTHENCVAITNHFYQSLIKKRIVMLNKNQSKKLNSWKYATVLPALIAFVMLFQVNVIAQEKVDLQATPKNIKTNEKAIDVYEIDKNTTDEELKEKSRNLKENYAIIADFSGIKRNSKNELTAIKVNLKKGKEIAQKMETKGNEAINKFGIIVSKNNDGMLTVNFGSDENSSNQQSMLVVPNAPSVIDKEIFIDGKKVSNEELDRTNPDDIATMNVSKENNKSIINIVTKGKTSQNANIFNSKVQATTLGLENVDPISLNILQKPKNPYTITKKTTEIIGIPGDAEYFIDGKKVSPLEAENMNPNHISSVNVEKDGASAKNSIRIIKKSYLDTKEMIPELPTPPTAPTFKSKAPREDHVKKDNKGWEINFGTFSPEDNIKKIQINKNVDYKKAVIVINGKISDFETLDKLKPDEIDNMSVEKISTNLEARKMAMIKKYGEKALNGIIEVQTKEFQKK
ncbi:BlaR1 peptidase M56 [Flavobacterium omnivorum]|uniref:BlaR1 peptidase M56 n=1 Tax=Flavobacterium omnivorum TaxID=178355 RepID=A0A1G7ZIZ4_9FLAO|nr:M56 family metallopeptidase [Flavobacterium omnivorum]SDH08644.1 BlaR1 peptidase M56 [Flavobacterium omnivorum]